MKIAYKYILLVLLVALSIGSLSAADKERRDTVINYLWAKEKSYYHTTGSFLTVGESELEKRTMGDLRNRLTGMIPGLEVTESAGGLWPSEFGYTSFSNEHFNLNMRGSSSIGCIIDDIAVPFDMYLLDPNQIESITVLADIVDRARFGAIASDGALLIRTKSGGYNTPFQIRADVEAGVSMTGRISEWVNGVEYADLNNRARAAAGYSTLYSPDAIEGFRNNDAYDVNYPNVDYKSLMLKEMFPVTRVGLNFFGGEQRVKYNFSMNGLYAGDIAKIGSITDNSKINLSGSVTAKVSRYIEISANFSTMLAFRRWGRASWNNYRSVPAVAYPLSFGINDVSEGDEGDEGPLGSTIYGVSRTFGNNYYALQKEGGFNVSRTRSGLANAAVDVDMSWLLKGLKSRTSFSLSTAAHSTIGKYNDYLAYYWTAENGKDVISPHKGEKATGKSIKDSYAAQTLGFYENLSYDWEADGHKIAAAATFVLNTSNNKNYNRNLRQMFGNLDLSYSYKGKYIAEFVGQLAGSQRLKAGNRSAFFPAGGVAWVLSREGFMKDVSWVDNLKLHAQAGLTGQSDIFGTLFLYRADYSFANGMWYGPVSDQDSWFGTERWTSQKTTMNRLENPDLGWSKILQVDAGIDFDFLRSFSLHASYFRRETRGTIADISEALPTVFGLNGVSLYDNYTSSITNGFDISLQYNGVFGDWRVSAGVSASTWETVYKKLVDDTYLYEYQKRTGTESDAYWGLKYIGKYETQEQIDNLPSYGSNLEVGDLIYADVNQDGIVDANDRINLGHTAPRLRYAVNLSFGYKNFEVQVVGTGRAFFKTALTNSYYWNGWGDGNYSAFVRDNIGGDYPRLSYVQSDNNFVASDFWLRDGGWFKIQDTEIAYTLHLNKKRSTGLSNIRFSLRGQNLATFSKIKDLDPEAMNAGVSNYPLFRTVTAGIKLTF